MRFIILAVTLSLIGGCAQQYVATAEPTCGAIRTIWVSKSDILTPITASQIEANNLAREKLCGRSRPPPRETTTAKGATS